MKIAVITRHAISNYGSLLQAYATQYILEKLGYQCEIIDYIRDDESYKQHEKTLLKQKSDWNNNFFKRALYLTIRQPESLVSGRRFEKERKKYLHLSRRYTDYKELKNNCPQADIYMTGSDQVWGPTENGIYDPTYCLEFTSEEAKRISYAASFGRTTMTQQVQQYYSRYLSRYAHISVRENSAVELVEKIGIKVEQVLDPTLLLSAQEWRSMFTFGKYAKKKYILVYQLHNDPMLSEYAKMVSKAKNLPLVRLSTAFHQIFRSGKFVWNPKVTEFLDYIAQADCLITDSFHGTAFAINLNTQFVEVLPNNNTGTRNQSILELTGLEERILKNETDIDLAFKKIDFNSVNEKIEKERERSLKILKKMLEE